MSISVEYGLGKAKGKKGIGKLLKKVSLKNAVKVVKFAAPIGASFIPGGGAVSKLVAKGGKIAGKGIKLANKAKATGVGKFVVKNKGLVKSVVPKRIPGKPSNPRAKAPIFRTQRATANQQPTTNYEQPTVAQSNYGSQDANQDPVEVQQGGRAIAQQIAAQPQYQEQEPQGEVTPVKQVIPQNFSASVNMDDSIGQATPLNTTAKNNTMLYVLAGVAVVGVVYVATKDKKTTNK